MAAGYRHFHCRKDPTLSTDTLWQLHLSPRSPLPTALGDRGWGRLHPNLLVQGNYIGLDPTGTSAEPNLYGVFVNDAMNNMIGGTAPGAGNVIAGNLPVDQDGSTGIFFLLSGSRGEPGPGQPHRHQCQRQSRQKPGPGRLRHLALQRAPEHLPHGGQGGEHDPRQRDRRHPRVFERRPLGDDIGHNVPGQSEVGAVRSARPRSTPPLAEVKGRRGTDQEDRGPLEEQAAAAGLTATRPLNIRKTATIGNREFGPLG